MSSISPQLPSVNAAAILDRQSKPAGQTPARSTGAADQSLIENAGTPPASTDTGLESTLARIQGQNQASALTTLRDLDEAMAATLLARQSLLAQSDNARAAHAGLTPASVLRVLEE